MKKSFVMYMSWGPLIKNMAPEDAGLLMQAIYIYQESGQEPEKDSKIYPAFAMIRAMMDEDAEKYDKKCQNLKNHRVDTDSTPIREKNARVDTDSIEKSPESAVIMGDSLSLSYTNTLSDSLSNKNKDSVNNLQRYFEDEKLNEVFMKYLASRGQSGDIELTQRELYNMAKGDIDTMIKILEKSLAMGWKGIFPLKDEKARGPTNRMKNHDERKYDMSDLEAELSNKFMKGAKV